MLASQAIAAPSVQRRAPLHVEATAVRPPRHWSIVAPSGEQE